LLRNFEPHEPDPEKLIEHLQKLADRGVEWAIEAVKKLKETGG